MQGNRAELLQGLEDRAAAVIVTNRSHDRLVGLPLWLWHWYLLEVHLSLRQVRQLIFLHAAKQKGRSTAEGLLKQAFEVLELLEVRVDFVATAKGLQVAEPPRMDAIDNA